MTQIVVVITRSFSCAIERAVVHFITSKIQSERERECRGKGPERNVGLNLCSKSKPLIDSFFGEEERGKENN